MNLQVEYQLDIYMLYVIEHVVYSTEGAYHHIVEDYKV